MPVRVTVVDYGASNLLSVCRALTHCGAEIVLAAESAPIGRADRLVLPGVGAFGDAMRGLERRGLTDAIRSFAATDRPFLGICVGMQILFDVGEEFGNHAGLGLLPGAVRRLADVATDGRPMRVPHIGWTAIEPAEPWAGSPRSAATP